MELRITIHFDVLNQKASQLNNYMTSCHTFVIIVYQRINFCAIYIFDLFRNNVYKYEWIYPLYNCVGLKSSVESLDHVFREREIEYVFRERAIER